MKLKEFGPMFEILQQGDSPSPKLFINTLEEVADTGSKMGRKGYCHRPSEVRYLPNLRFADDIAIFSPAATGQEQTLEVLSDESLQVGLKINIWKTNHDQLEQPHRQGEYTIRPKTHLLGRSDLFPGKER